MLCLSDPLVAGVPRASSVPATISRNRGVDYMGTTKTRDYRHCSRYCAQLRALGIRVDRAILLVPMPAGRPKMAAILMCSIVSSDFETLNTRERLETPGHGLPQRLWQPIGPLRVPLLSWCTWNPPRFWKKSCRQGCKSLNGGTMGTA